MCRLFTVIMKHSRVPCEFGYKIVIPLVKDEHGDFSYSDNYRGVFELLLLHKFSSFLHRHADSAQMLARNSGSFIVDDCLQSDRHRTDEILHSG